MKVFYSNDFTGKWPVPTAAIVIAPDEEIAKLQLARELLVMGLPGKNFTVTEVDVTKPAVLILSDGEY